MAEGTSARSKPGTKALLLQRLAELASGQRPEHPEGGAR
jgi:hypothetical protein